tara:strand:- start:1522 stop:1749 length:228 start_codon:yes stop_codon:yes gene_type:complete
MKSLTRIITGDAGDLTEAHKKHLWESSEPFFALSGRIVSNRKAVAPWWLNQVAGRFKGPYPSTSLVMPKKWNFSH